MRMLFFKVMIIILIISSIVRGSIYLYQSSFSDTVRRESSLTWSYNSMPVNADAPELTTTFHNGSNFTVSEFYMECYVHYKGDDDQSHQHFVFDNPIAPHETRTETVRSITNYGGNGGEYDTVNCTVRKVMIQ